MDIRKLFFFITPMFLMKHALGMRHLVYWNGKLIPELLKDGLLVTVEINDWMDVLCPYYTGENARLKISPADYLFLYNVTEYGFDSCDTRGGIRVQQCDDPRSERKLTTKFQESSPSPYGFTFRPGATYYYISKPIGSDSSKGCTEDTLKMIVRVERKGTVFDSRDKAIKFYDLKSRKHHKKTHNTGQDREKKHHHHQQHSSVAAKTATTTTSPKNAIYQQTLSRHKSKGPENAGYPMYRCTNTVLITIISIFATWVLRFR